MDAELYMHVSDADGEGVDPVLVGGVPATATDLGRVPDAIHLAPLLIAGVIGDQFPEITSELISYVERAIEMGHELTHISVREDGEWDRRVVGYTMADPESVVSFLQKHEGRTVYTTIQRGEYLATNALFLPRSIQS